MSVFRAHHLLLESLLLFILLSFLLVSPSFGFSSNTIMPPPVPPGTRSQSLTNVDEIFALTQTRTREAAPASWITTAAMVLVGIPTTLGIVLPLSIIYQVGKQITHKVTGHDATTASLLTPIVSSTKVVPQSEIIPHVDRKYDLIILGATGFTGSMCVRHLALTYNNNNNNTQKVRWAIAGRSQTKLNQVKERWAKELNMPDIMNIDTILVDTTDATTLAGLVQNTKAISTTAGPFEKYGSPVVEFCAKYGTHYCDISGEVSWNQCMMKEWEATAKATGAKIVSLCGSDCIPWDLSTMAMEAELMAKDEEETLTTVTFSDELVGMASGGTIDTALMGILGTSRGPPDGNPDYYLKLPDGSQSNLKFQFKFPILPKKITVPSYLKGSWAGFFPLSLPNSEVVKRGIALRGNAKDVVYEEYGLHPDFKTGLVQLLGLQMGVIMLLNPLTGYLVKKVLPKPGEGPSMDDMQNKFFGITIGYAEGSKGTTVESIMYFPQDQGYLDTARMVTEAGLCLAFDGNDAPTQEGGFWSPSIGMGPALLKRLRETGTYFGTKISTS